MAQSTILLLPFGDKKQRCATLETILLIKINYVKQSLKFNDDEKEKLLHNKRNGKDAESCQNQL